MTMTVLTAEQQHFSQLLQKCRHENNAQRLLNHMQALKTFLLAHTIQQSTLYHQLKEGQIIEGKLEAHIIKECAGCMGESKKALRALHDFINRYEDKEAEQLDNMEFRASAFQLLKRFEKNLKRFSDWIVHLEPQAASC